MTAHASQLRYGVVGLGRLGCALVDALRRAGLGPSAVVAGAARAGGQALPAELLCTIDELPYRVDRIFVTVPDDRLAGVAERLDVGARHAVVHCSGAKDLSVLSPSAQRGAQVGSFHPLQAFPVGSDGERFVGIAVGIEADEPLLSELTALAEQVGARALSLRGVNRARYHAAAVFVSNYTVALMEAATCALEEAGLPASEAPSALLPLMTGAVAAMVAHPLADALTGPLARGDVKTVQDHMDALATDPPLQQSYAALGSLLLRLDRPRDAELRQQLQALFEAQGAVVKSRSGR